MSNPPSVLAVDRLTIRFDDVVVLRNLSFAVAAGEALAVIGPNGAGKTALFRALIGAISFEGRVEWAAGVRLGYVPQTLDLERDMPVSGFDFLRARTAIGGVAADIEQALASVGLSVAAARRPIGTLSGGQFQRLLLAFALIGAPSVLLLDEPTAGVDERGQEHLNELIHRLQVERGLTVLLISHELSVVYRYASTVLCLGPDGAHCGAPGDVLSPESLRALYGTEMATHRHEH